MPSEHDVRQRASICQDCWFWKEMSCALASPENGVCANRRPVRGRRPEVPAAPIQATLVPLAAGHAAEPPRPGTAVPFAATAPEATFSLTQAREPAGGELRPTLLPDAAAMQPTRTTPPSFRDIRAGRAAAASRTPIAEVRIAAAELDGATLTGYEHATAPGMSTLPGMEQLVERVRQRTTARLSRSGALSTA